MKGRRNKNRGKPSVSIRSVKAGESAIYFIPCVGGWLQIDTASAGYWKTFCRKIRKSGIDLNQIKYLLITHHHDDHGGFAAELVQETGATLIVHEKAVGRLASGYIKKEDMHPPTTRRIQALFAIRQFYHRYVFTPVRLRAGDWIVRGDDDQILKSIGIDGKILYTPGHNDDCISVVLADGSAFVGDAATSIFEVFGAKHRPPFIKFPDEVYRSWEKLRKSGARVIHPTHGKPFGAEKLVPVR